MSSRFELMASLIRFGVVLMHIMLERRSRL
ncbi:hypothetical protein CsSME_00044473 [Camellia sinensis var. sinensis]